MDKKRLLEILKRKSEIRTVLNDKNATIDFDVVTKELDDLEREERELQRKMELLERVQENPNQGEVRTIDTPQQIEKRETDLSTKERRGKALKEKRSITVGSSKIVVPKHTGDTINGTFNDVSSLIDRVQHKLLPGGESFEQPYVEEYVTEADYTDTIGGQYNQVETRTNYASITKTKVTAYQEEPEEVEKLSDADYSGLIEDGTTRALRKKLTKEILIGNGGSGRLVGIFSDKATAIDPTTDLEIATIDEKTLDNIIFEFGGDEDVEDESVLILSKNTLKKFAMCRLADGKKAYEVKTKGNTGTIDEVPFIINSACKSLDTAAPGEYLMAYGPLSNYMLAIFSDADIQKSSDYKFKEGMIAHRGSIFTGGNVVAKNGFLRVKKSA